MIRSTMRAAMALLVFSAFSTHAQAQCTGTQGAGPLEAAGAANVFGAEHDTGTTSSMAPNMGSYVSSDGVTWYLTGEWYDPNPQPTEDEFVVPAWHAGPGGGGDPGGGGYVNSGPCTLPATVVTATTYSGGGGMLGFSGRMRLGGGGGSSQMWLPVPSIRMPDNPINPHPADCGSSREQRWSHAVSDAGVWLARAANRNSISIGQLLRVTYDDGTSEAWVYTGYASPTLGEIPAFEVRCPP